MTYPGIEFDKAALAVNPDMAAVEERRAEREAEYDKFVALDVIPWGTVIAFAKGDRVPSGTVERLHWHEEDSQGRGPWVAERDSEDGRRVLLETDSATTEEKEAWAKKSSAKTDKATDSKAGSK